MGNHGVGGVSGGGAAAAMGGSGWGNRGEVQVAVVEDVV